MKVKHSNTRYLHRQSGAALLLVLVFLLLVGAGFLLEKISSRASINASVEQRSAAALAEAKTALIGWAVSNPSEPGRLPWPDRSADGNYDGLSDCVTSGFNDSHLLGRFPFAGENAPCSNLSNPVEFGSFAHDGTGEPLWYAVSRNLLSNRDQDTTVDDPPISLTLLDNPATYSWISVCDQAGNLISNRVAAVIIAPGAALSGQDRSGAAPNPNQYLDSVTVAGNTYNNFDSDGLQDAASCGAPGEDFIIYPDSRLTPAVNDSFNDRLIYITIDELMPKVERRVLGDAAVVLEKYRADYGRYPWLSPFRNPIAFTGPDTLTGRLEEVNGGDNDRLVDDEANFPPDGPNQLDGDPIVNVTRRTVWEVKDQHDPDDIHLEGNPDFEVGHAYNVRPAFNGVWGQREGQIPFIAAGETYAFATGWTVSWSNGTSTVPTCPAAGFPAGLTIDTTPTGCGSLLTNPLVDPLTGSGVMAQPAIPIPAADNGNCIWTDINTVDCMNNTEVRSITYNVDLTCADASCGGAAPYLNWPVTRTFIYKMDFAGNGQVSPTVVGNVKTRQVTNTGPITIQMQDTVNVNSTDYILWSDTVTVPANNYVVDGVYFGIEDGVEFPGYFFTNLWHHYIYVKISDEHVAINDIGSASSGNCTVGGDCVSLQIGTIPVRDDIQAIVVGAGGQLTGQDRSNGNLTDYFENTNATPANDLAERSAITATFNDQARVVAPLPP